MRRLLRSILFGSSGIKSFFGIRVAIEDVKEKMILIAERTIDITQNHCIVCQNPYTIAIWFTPEQKVGINDPEEITVSVTLFKKTRTTAKGLLSQKIKTNGLEILLYKISDPKCYQINIIKQFFILKYYLATPSTTFRERKTIASLFSFPRKVIIVACKNKAHYNIFPMDFHGYDTATGTCILGLRTTNITLHHIVESKKIVIADTTTIDLKTLYTLGEHHSKKPPGIEQLPFDTIRSNLFGFPIPSLSNSYQEIRILSNHLIGSHMLLIGKTVNNFETGKNLKPLFHLHLFEFLGSGYSEA